MQKLVIDKEFQSLIPPLTQDEYKQLEENILEFGCIDTIKVWTESYTKDDDGFYDPKARIEVYDGDDDHTIKAISDIIVDGHNRYEICMKHNVPFETVEMDFEDRNEAILWIINNQRGRRNLSKPDSIMLAQKKAEILAIKAKENQSAGGGDRKSESYKNAFIQMDKTDSRINVQKEIAKDAGVSTGTVARFEVVQKNKPELIDKIRSGDMSISQAYNAVKLDEKKQQILDAERAVHEEADETYKPLLFIGDSIGYTPSEPYDLLLTDPPYSTDVPDIDVFAQKWLYNALNHVKPTGFAYVFIGAYPDEIKAYLNAPVPDHMKLCQQLIWTYRNTLGQNPKDRYKLNYQVCLFYRGVNAPNLNVDLTNEQWAVQDINAPDGRQGDRYHAWQKPMELAERFIRHSTTPGMTVFDPFACTGTFLLAATKLGRKAYGFELNEENAAIAVTRGCMRA